MAPRSSSACRRRRGSGFVTGATMANFTALAAARHALLARPGWDVEARGLFGAPPITVVVGEEAHRAAFSKRWACSAWAASAWSACRWTARGGCAPRPLPRSHGPTIVCIQAGNVNTGAFDPAAEICAVARAGAWVHVDGAFGLWAAAAPERAHLVAGVAEADSWATDAHKWLNVPYDSGLAFVRDAEQLRRPWSCSAAYLTAGGRARAGHYTPEMSRRARGVEVWAALRSLGRSGLAELVERCCRHAARFAEGLRRAGYQVLNDVVLNQVLVSFGDAERTRRVIAAHPAGRHLLVRRHGLAGPRRHAHQRVLVGHHRGGRGAQPGGDPADRRRLRNAWRSSRRPPRST